MPHSSSEMSVDSPSDCHLRGQCYAGTVSRTDFGSHLPRIVFSGKFTRDYIQELANG